MLLRNPRLTLQRHEQTWKAVKRVLAKPNKRQKLASATLYDARTQSVESANTVVEALRQLAGMSNWAQLSKDEFSFLASQMSEIFKARDDARSSANKQSQKSKMLEACIDLLKDNQDSLKQKYWTGCDMEVMRCKVADVKVGMSSLVDGLRRGYLDSYASIHDNVDHSLLAIGSRLREMIEREAKGLQRGVHAALRDAAGGFHESGFGVAEVVDRSLSLIVWHSKRDESAMPRSSSAHLANLERPQSRTRAASEEGVRLRAMQLEALRLLLLVRRIFMIILGDLK